MDSHFFLSTLWLCLGRDGLKQSEVGLKVQKTDNASFWFKLLPRSCPIQPKMFPWLNLVKKKNETKKAAI